jgi:hypothetical protein
MTGRDAPTTTQIRSRIKWMGVKDFQYTNDGRSIVIQAYTPAGVQWKATGCHTLVVSAFTNPKEARRAFMQDISLGVQLCDNKDCEFCNPVEAS